MRNYYKKFILSIITLIVSFSSFAQIPNADEAGGGGGDPPAPIDNQIIWLAVIGLLFAVYAISSRIKKA
jgi:hypothetical protein